MDIVENKENNGNVMKKCIYLLGVCMLLLLNACQEDDEVVQKEEEQLPTLEDVELASIAEESLNGWDAGFSYKGGYCVGKRDTIDGTSTLHINYPGGNIDDGMTMVFDVEDELVDVFFRKNIFHIYKEDNLIYVNQMDSEGKLKGCSTYESAEKIDSKIDSRVVATTTKLTSKTVSEYLKKVANNFKLKKGNYDGTDKLSILDALKDLTQTDQIVEGVYDGNKFDVALNVAFFAAGFLVVGSTAVTMPIVAGLILVELGVDAAKDAYYNKAKDNIYGSAEIMIMNVANDGENNFTLSVDISGIGSIPSKFREGFIEYDNTVYCGIVAYPEGYKGLPSYYNNHGNVCSPTPVSISNNSRRKFTMSVNNNPSKVVFRPYLITEREYKAGKWSMGKGKYIKYGEPFKYERNRSSIFTFKQTADDYESNVIVFKADIEVFNFNGDNEQWGLYIDLENGLKGRFPAQYGNKMPGLTSVQFTVPINDEHLELDYDKYRATYKKSIGVYHVDEMGNYTYGEMKDFEFIYITPPNIKFTYADIIGTREVKSESASRAAPGPGGEGDGDDGDDEDDSDKKEYVTEFIQYFDIKGSLWIKQIDYVKDEGTPTFESQSVQPMKDKSYTTKGTIKYNAKMPNISAISRYSITLRNGKQVQWDVNGCYYNRLYWSGENKITDVNWR